MIHINSLIHVNLLVSCILHLRGLLDLCKKWKSIRGPYRQSLVFCGNLLRMSDNIIGTFTNPSENPYGSSLNDDITQQCEPLWRVFPKTNWLCFFYHVLVSIKCLVWDDWMFNKHGHTKLSTVKCLINMDRQH